MKFSVDEWGVWAVPSNTVNNEIDEKPWQIAPAISEQIYTLEDALLFAEMQMVIIRNADAIKIACQSLLTNISACIMTEKGGGIGYRLYIIHFIISQITLRDSFKCLEYCASI